MRILGAFALLATSLAVTACQTTSQPSAEQIAERKAVASFNERVDATLLDAAATAEQRGDYQTALTHYRSAYDRDKTNLATVLGFSRTLRNMGRPKEAIAVDERGLEVHKRHPGLLAELGKAQLADGDAFAAIDSLSRAGALQPGDWRVESALGVAYDRIGMYDQAARRYQLALEQNTTNPVVLNNLALSKAQTGKLDEAIVILEKAASMPDATAHMRQNLALLYAAKGRIDNAERLVRRDLDEKTANDNMVYYRWLSRNGRDQPVAIPVEPSGQSSRPGTDSVTLEVSKAEFRASDIQATGPSRDVMVTPIVPPPPDMREAVPGTEVSSAEAMASETTPRPPSSDPGDVPSAPKVVGDTAPDQMPPTETATPVQNVATANAPDGHSQMRDEPPAEAGAREFPSAPETRNTNSALDQAPPRETEIQVQDVTSATSLEDDSEMRDEPPAEARARETRAAPESRSEETTVSREMERPEVTSPPPLAATARDQVDDPTTIAALPAAPASSRTDDTPDASPEAQGLPISLTPPVTPETTLPPPAEVRDDAKAGDTMAARKTDVAAISRTGETTTTAPNTGSGRGSSIYRVQLGSYRNREDANNGIQILQTSHGDILENIELGIMAVTLPESGDYYRVMTAPFPSRVGAIEICRKFKSREVGCLVLRRR